jgi:regulatory protein
MGGRSASAYRTALDMLGRSALTRAELRDRLGRKGFPLEEVEETVGRLVELGQLRDDRIAERLVERRVLERGYGRARAVEEMTRRGIPAEVADRALESITDEDEEAALRRSLESWCGQHGAPGDDPALRRLVAHLRHRGFREERIRRAVLDGRMLPREPADGREESS